MYSSLLGLARVIATRTLMSYRDSDSHELLLIRSNSGKQISRLVSHSPQNPLSSNLAVDL